MKNTPPIAGHCSVCDCWEILNGQCENCGTKTADLLDYVQSLPTLCELQSDVAAHQWAKLQAADPLAAIYLYYRTGQLGAFAGDHTPEGWTLGTGHRLNPMGNQEEVRAFIYQTARRLPFLPV